MFAGGAIKGGYYGDVRVAGPERDGHKYTVHAPNPVTGVPGAAATTDQKGRLAGSYAYRTVVDALKVPASVLARYPLIAGVSSLPYIYKG